MKKAKAISSNLDNAYLSQVPTTPETIPTIEEKSTADIVNRLKMAYNLGIKTTADLPSPSGAIGRILFHSMKTTDNEMSLTEIVNNTDGNRSYILLHPSGAFDVYNNAGDHVLKAVGDQIIVGKDITIEAAGTVNIVSASETIPLDTIVTEKKLQAYLAKVPDSMGTLIFASLMPSVANELGTKEIKVGKS
jgi:hypothetical protein